MVNESQRLEPNVETDATFLLCQYFTTTKINHSRTNMSQRIWLFVTLKQLSPNGVKICFCIEQELYGRNPKWIQSKTWKIEREIYIHLWSM